MRVSGLALALVVVCASGCVCAAASQPQVLDESVLSHQYEIVIHPDFEKDAVWVGGSDEVSLPATEYPWVTINLLADCGIAIVRRADRGFSFQGDCALEARAPIGVAPRMVSTLLSASTQKRASKSLFFSRIDSYRVGSVSNCTAVASTHMRH